MLKIKVNDIILAYKVFIDGKEAPAVVPSMKTIIVLHGGPGIADHSLYVKFWSRFAKLGVQVIFPDQRGNGESEKGDESKWTIPDCARDLNEFCTKLNIVKPIVCGVSWGGYVAISYATQFPQAPGALILCNTEAKVSAEARRDKFRALGGEAAASAVWTYDTNPQAPQAYKNFIKHCLPHYAKNPYTKEDLQYIKLNLPMREKFLREENLKFNFLDDMPKIMCPVLYFAGTDDAAHPYEAAVVTSKGIEPDLLTFVEVKEAGSPVYRDAPDLVESEVVKFIT